MKKGCLMALIFCLLPLAALAKSPEKTDVKTAALEDAPVVIDLKNPYEKLALEISSEAAKMENKKIAVLPFSYADSSGSVKDGSVISERLIMKLVKGKKFQIIERSALDKVLGELKLENSGVVDAVNAKELGKVLGVDAIVTGTLVKTKDGRIEVNARLIKTETAEALAAYQVYVFKDWEGGDVQKVEKGGNQESGRGRRFRTFSR